MLTRAVAEGARHIIVERHLDLRGREQRQAAALLVFQPTTESVTVRRFRRLQM
jgi:hypothetical protein